MAELVEERRIGKAGMFRQWNIDNTELDDAGFNDMEQIPGEAKAFTGLSNGSLVTCYLWNDGTTLHIRRPNPNNKGIYQPLSVEEHIDFCIKNGYV